MAVIVSTCFLYGGPTHCSTSAEKHANETRMPKVKLRYTTTSFLSIKITFAHH